MDESEFNKLIDDKEWRFKQLVNMTSSNTQFKALFLGFIDVVEQNNQRFKATQAAFAELGVEITDDHKLNPKTARNLKRLSEWADFLSFCEDHDIIPDYDKIVNSERFKQFAKL